MDTPTIAAYYREQDALKRKELLEQSIAAGEEPEANEIRKELWELRYQESSRDGKGNRADGFLGLWMAMEFNRGASGKFFGTKSAQKEIRKQLDKLKFNEEEAKSPLHRELLYRECYHLVNLYISLSQKDKTYNSLFFGIVSMKEDRSRDKLKSDIQQTGIRLPKEIGMEKELGLIMKAANDAYELNFAGE